LFLNTIFIPAQVACLYFRTRFRQQRGDRWRMGVVHPT